jgi:hypothetical protein
LLLCRSIPAINDSVILVSFRLCVVVLSNGQQRIYRKETFLRHTAFNVYQFLILRTRGTGGSAQTTRTSFDAMGRATNILQPDGTSKITAYFLTGLPKKKYGSRDYPVEYTYDPQGRLKTMTTWTNFAASGTAAVSAWHYDANRGWLTNKVYADSQGTKYSYTDGGCLSTRLWARGISTWH